MKFERTLLINLDRRPDRWEESVDACAVVGIVPERFPAVDGQTEVTDAEAERGIAFDYRIKRLKHMKGLLACARSHRMVMERLLTEGVEGPALILEDDVGFTPDYLERMEAVEQELPEDWEMLILGGVHHKNPRGFSKNLCRPTRIDCTHAYIVRGKAVIGDLRDLFDAENRGPDRLWDPVVNTRGLAVTPIVAIQRDSYSDIVHARMDKFRPDRKMRA